MKVAITGAGGLFGHGLVQVFSRRHEVVPLTHADVEITEPENVREVFQRARPEVVIHAAANRDPDWCELNPVQAFRVNFLGTRAVADAAREIGAAVAYISSDAVFDGKKSSPYTESDPAIPRTVYGRTKLGAERAVLAQPASWAFRVSVLFGPEPKGKPGFLGKGLAKLAAGEEYEVAADQLGSATYTLDAAATIMEVIEARRYGLYHLANRGACTRLDLARRAAGLAGLDANKVIGRPLAEMGRPAPRLKYAVMEMQGLRRAGFSPPRAWQEALEEYVRSLGRLIP